MDGGGYYNRGSGGAGRGRGRGRGGGGSSGGGGRGGNQYQNQQSGQQQGGGGGGGSRGRGGSRGGPLQMGGDPTPPRNQGFRPVQAYRPTQAARPVPVESTAGYGRGRSAVVGGRGAWDSPSSVRAWGPPPSTVAGPSQRSPEPIPDIQRLKISETQPSLESTEKRVPIKRPDVGTLAVRSVRLLTNHFKVNFNPNSTILHYDIDIKLDISSTSRPTKRSISKSDLRSIKDKLFSTHPDKFPLLMTAYDGEKNIFSAVELPTGQFKVELSGGEDSRTRAYLFNIQKVNELKLSKLNSYLRKNLFDLPRDTLQGMDLVMKDNPMKYRISCGRSFYDMESRRDDDLGYGLAAHRGFKQSLKPTSNGLALCLDYSVLAFRKRMPLLDFLYEQGFPEPKDIKDVKRYRMDVLSVIEGLKVTVTHRLSKQKYTISGLTERNTRDINFDLADPEGNIGSRNVSLVDYFREKYGKEIVHKDIPCLDVGKNNRQNYVPMEVCVLVEGQRYPKENLERLDRDSALFLKKLSLARPRDRMNSICGMVRAQDGPSGEVTRNFGIGVDTDMTKVVGRVIGPPDLKLGGSLRPVKVDKDKCQWNLVGKQVADGKRVNRWAVIDFSSTDRRFRLQQPNIFVQNLQNRCISLGIFMDQPVVFRSTGMNEFSNIHNIQRLLESVVGEAYKKCKDRLQIIICVMAGRHNGYKLLKWVSETKIGVLTQCCLSANCNKGQDQYFANLGLKINAKLGGSNAELIEPLPHFAVDDHVMFIGADVNHPPANNITCPSIAAVVGTMNWPAANRYAARVCPQKHREERIMGFGSMCLDLVNAYARINGVKPKKILVFRDGVSDGQNDMVLNEELTALKSALYSDHYRPLITVVVAVKRHHTRLFLENEREGGQSGNVPPGTVVDTTITHPFEFDFYLCSHYGGIGTSKPTHYYVVWDENNFGSDELQRIIYNLCFTFARCTKPVSLVPPVYYADLVAYRGRLFQEAAMESRSPVSASSSSSLATTSSAGSLLDESFYTMQPELQNVMFFV